MSSAIRPNARTTHVHLYEWVGPGTALDANLERRSETGTLPPFEIRAWIRRRESSAVSEPAKAAAWLAERARHFGSRLYGSYAPVEHPAQATFADRLGLTERISRAVEDLNQGQDVIWGFWLDGGSTYVFLVALTVARGECGRH